MAARRARAPEIWGGVECTVSRSGDRYVDQLALTGHADRLDDLDRIAALGIRTLRYPVLWERTETQPGECDWRWPDERLTRLQALGIDPIAGLVHHGSGPRWTSLLHDDFAPGVAAFAGRVAGRYPWIRRYTVVNEPLTTARFSGLYGHWFPHGRDDRTFVRALVNQVRAIQLGMAAIRAVRPDAELVQTEDISQTFSERPLRQTAFYNARRWLSFDLLCGRVDASHDLYRYLVEHGACPGELASLRHDAVAPTMLGLNYYVASDRYLDEQVDRHPPDRHHRTAAGEVFVDVDASRAAAGILGHAAHIDATWARYQLPIAITEVHLDGSGEAQIRWLADAWEAACASRRAGVPVEAVTTWALFGCVDWDSLLTRLAGYYEPGAFDARGPIVRPRALAHAISTLARGGAIAHPAVRGPRWWQRGAASATPAAPILIAGHGTLGAELARTCEARGLACRLVSRADLDIANAGAVAAMIDEVKPWALINACGFVRVDDAETALVPCWRSNVTGPRVLADACARRGVPLVTFSSDLVFDGRAASPYVERDSPAPLSVYGRSKQAAERAVVSRDPTALVIRTAAFFGPRDRGNFVTAALRQMLRGEAVPAADDLEVSPTYVPDLAAAALELLIDRESGVWHLANVGRVTWWQLARAAADRLRLDASLVQAAASADLRLAAPRPRFSALGSERGALMPTLDSALDRYVAGLDRRLIEGA